MTAFVAAIRHTKDHPVGGPWDLFKSDRSQFQGPPLALHAPKTATFAGKMYVRTCNRTKGEIICESPWDGPWEKQKIRLAGGKVAFGETLLNLKAHRSREGETYNNCYRCNKTANPFCRFFFCGEKRGKTCVFRASFSFVFIGLPSSEIQSSLLAC